MVGSRGSRISVTLEGDWPLFGSLRSGVAVLEVYLNAVSGMIREAVLDPVDIHIPVDVNEDYSPPVMEPGPPKRRHFMAVTEAAIDVSAVEGRRKFAELAYCSALATVWSTTGGELFEATDYGQARYCLPADMLVSFLTELDKRHLSVPTAWRTSTSM